jgi:hypothetical protein
MPSNPVTDQYLAAITAPGGGHSGCAQQPCALQTVEQTWCAGLLLTLPDIDPAIVGQVLLHAGRHLPSLGIAMSIFGTNPLTTVTDQASSLQFIGAELLTTNK